MAKQTKAAIYLRVSTSDKNQSTDLQLDACRKYVEANGWKYDIYEDKVSAVKHRPNLNSLLAECHKRTYDVVVVWKLDRFARSLSHFTEMIGQLDSYKVRFVSLTEGIDTDRSNPAARLLMNIMASFADFERNLISERVKEGMRAKTARGFKMGRKGIEKTGLDRKVVLAAMRASKDMGGLSLDRLCSFIAVNFKIKVSRSTLARKMKEWGIQGNAAPSIKRRVIGGQRGPTVPVDMAGWVSCDPPLEDEFYRGEGGDLDA